jgi:hypothetical protein
MKHNAGHNSVVIASEKDDYLSEKDYNEFWSFKIN